MYSSDEKKKKHRNVPSTFYILHRIIDVSTTICYVEIKRQMYISVLSVRIFFFKS